MQEKSIFEHLEDLRSTIMVIAIILVISFVITFSYGDFFCKFLLGPLRHTFVNDLTIINGKIIYIGILDKVLSQFQVSLWVAIIISSPLWFYQLWRFIKPGLYKKEVIVVRPFIILSFILFCLGVSFGHYLVLPILIKTFAHFGVQNIQATINLKDYLVLSSKLLVLSGFVFQIPNVLLVIGLIGLVSEDMLRSNRRYVYLGFAIFSIYFLGSKCILK